MLLGSICSILHFEQLEVRGGGHLPRATWLTGATASPDLRPLMWCSGTSPGPQRNPPGSSPQGEEVLTRGASPVVPVSFPGPEPVGHTLLTWDWLCLRPRQREGALAGPESDSYLSTQPSAREAGKPEPVHSHLPAAETMLRAAGPPFTPRPLKNDLGGMPAFASLTTSKPASPASTPMISPSPSCSGHTRQPSSPSLLVHYMENALLLCSF